MKKASARGLQYMLGRQAGLARDDTVTLHCTSEGAAFLTPHPALADAVIPCTWQSIAVKSEPHCIV